MRAKHMFTAAMARRWAVKWRDRPWPELLPIALSLGMAIACITRLVIYPSAEAEGDALYYQRYAFAFRDGGFLADFGSIRTYGYPAFLSLLSFFSGKSHQALSITAGVVQYALFLVFTLYLAARIGRISFAMGWAVRIGLLVNPLVVALVVDSLTEGLTIPLAVLLVICALASDRSKTIRVSLAYCTLGALISAVAIIIRPANIALMLAWHLSTFVALRRPNTLGKRTATMGVYFVTAALATAGALTPQLIYNYTVWNEITAFPVCRIANLQLTFGIFSLRYDSVVLNGITLPFSYLNPFFHQENLASLNSIGWYFWHPLSGFATIVGHLFAAFSVNHLFTYLYGGHPSYAPILAGLYWVVIVLGIASFAQCMFAWWKNSNLAAPQTAIFVILSFVLITGINAISAVELRFNVLPIAVLSAFACLLLFRNHAGHNKTIVILAVLVAVVFSAGSELLRSAGQLGHPAEAQFDLSAARCFLWRYP